MLVSNLANVSRKKFKDSNNISMIKIYLLYEYYIYIFLFEISLEFNFFFVQRSKNWEKKVCEILHSREIDRARRLIENHPCRVSRRVIPISVYIFFLSFFYGTEKKRSGKK